MLVGPEKRGSRPLCRLNAGQEEFDAANFSYCDFTVFGSQRDYGQALLPPESHGNRSLLKSLVALRKASLVSYDLEIWSVRQLLQAPAGTKVAWQAGPGGGSSGTHVWRFVIEDSVRVEPENLSAEVARSLPGVRYLTRFHLEGDSSSKLVSQALTSAEGIARTIYGLVADAQTNELILPSGVRRLNPIVPASDQESYTELRMSWWFLNDSRMISTHGFDRLLTLLEDVLPELLPQRYGTYEPLEFRY